MQYLVIIECKNSDRLTEQSKITVALVLKSTTYYKLLRHAAAIVSRQ